MDALSKWSWPEVLLPVNWADAQCVTGQPGWPTRVLLLLLPNIYWMCMSSTSAQLKQFSGAEKVVGFLFSVSRSSFPRYYIWSADCSQTSPGEREGAEIQENPRIPHTAKWWTVAESYNSCQRLFTSCWLYTGGTEEVRISLLSDDWEVKVWMCITILESSLQCTW